MLWLDTSWVLDLTYIFRPHISLFIVIFSTLTSFHHYFSTSHITTYYIHLLSFSPSLPTRHYPYSTLSGGLSHITTWRAVTSFPRFTSWVVVQISYFRRLSCQRWFILWNQGLVNLSFDDELMIIFQVWLGKTISKVAITKTNQAKEKSWRRRRPQRGVFFKTQSS